MTKKLLMGNEAFAHAALEAGVRVVAGYPGTPSSEVTETVAKLHASGAAQGIHVEWSTNEKSALELLAGASYCGARTLFTCKQVGLNVASDPLMSLNYVGVKGGTVLFVADDPGPISSQTEQDTRRFGNFAKVPVLDPATPDQGFDMMKAAFELSERYKTPVIVRPTTRVCHASTFFDVAEETHAKPIPEEGFERGPRWVIFPKRAFEGHGEINERLRAIAVDYSTNPVLSAFNPVDERRVAGQLTRHGIVAGGVSAAYALEALRLLEERASERGVQLPAYRFWQVGTPFPFPERTCAEFTKGLADVLVLEELDHVLEDELLAFAGRTHAEYNTHGKLTGEARDRGENDVDDILARLAVYLGVPELAEAEEATTYDNADPKQPLPVRPPVLCPGCPHRGSFYAVKRALGKTPAVFCGDIGCYTLGALPPLSAMDTCVDMGASVSMAHGFELALAGKEHRPVVAVIGDSTFAHSGLSSLISTVYNKGAGTVCILDNRTTAMTGRQGNPFNGETLQKRPSRELDLEGIICALGVEDVRTVDPHDMKAVRTALKEATGAADVLSVIVFRAPCVLLERVVKPAFEVTADCTACGICPTLGCPAIGKDGATGIASIDPSLCIGCGQCAQYCARGAIISTDLSTKGACHA